MTTGNVDAGKVKIMLLLPLLTFPFCALIFWALGGGTGQQVEKEKAPPGLNTVVPGPELNSRPDFDKLSLYQQADKDTNLWRSDEYEDMVKDQPMAPTKASGDVTLNQTFDGERHRLGSAARSGKAAPADQLEQRLQALQKSLDEQQDSDLSVSQPALTVPADTNRNAELEKLEKLMQQMGSAPVEQDLELQKMDGMLDKILDIQNPDRVKDRMSANASRSKENAISVVPEQTPPLVDWIGVDSLQPAHRDEQTYLSGDGFFELDDRSSMTATAARAIAAVIHNDQLLVSGATVKMRLVENINLQAHTIPAGSFIYGSCNLSGERLLVQVSGIQFNNALFTVNLQAYDRDGLPGIRIPGSISRDAAKKGTDDAIRAISMSTLDPSLGAQATAAGIETAKNLLSRKVKMIKVTVKADYPVLLRDMNNR